MARRRKKRVEIYLYLLLWDARKTSIIIEKEKDIDLNLKIKKTRQRKKMEVEKSVSGVGASIHDFSSQRIVYTLSVVCPVVVNELTNESVDEFLVFFCIRKKITNVCAQMVKNSA